MSQTAGDYMRQYRSHILSDRSRAIVVGASIAGLLAGRALKDHFDEVILLDKEDLTIDVSARKAVPQGNHAHIILTPMYRALQRFFPGLVDDLAAHGAVICDAGRDARVLIYKKTLANGNTGQPIIGSTRPFFEHHLRQHVSAIAGVEIQSNHRFEDWVTDSSRETITGVIAAGPQGLQHLPADLVVDARGRASTLISELTGLGYKSPEFEVVDLGLGYTSRLYRSPQRVPDWNVLNINSYEPDISKGGIVSRVENEKWVVTQYGYFGEHPPSTENGFLAFARTLDAPDVAKFLELAEPASDFCKIGMRESRINRFEKLDSFPERLLAVGDTVCSLNPVYGQGMTKAANEAVFLNDALDEHMRRHRSLDGFADRFRRGLPGAGAEWGWQLTRAADLSFKKATGKRSIVDAIMVSYMKQLLLRATQNVAARRGILDATMLVKPPHSLMYPRMLMRAIGLS
jgi:2-polyprenyl-6-methoxyphenol hydroxylase-like FAD-dependent oxidoreductase